MDYRLESIAEIIKSKQKELDEIEWADHRDPRIESLVQQLNYYRNKQDQGEVYEPKF